MVEKHRRPAWCDRVLWHSNVPQAAQLLSYSSASMTASDHMPVTATFVLSAREYDRCPPPPPPPAAPDTLCTPSWLM